MTNVFFEHNNVYPCHTTTAYDGASLLTCCSAEQCTVAITKVMLSVATRVINSIFLLFFFCGARKMESSKTDVTDPECPWCVAMRAGPCSSQFTSFQQCLRTAKEAAEDTSSASSDPSASSNNNFARYAKHCMDDFRVLHECIQSSAASREYYRPLIGKADEQDTDNNDVRT